MFQSTLLKNLTDENVSEFVSLSIKCKLEIERLFWNYNLQFNISFQTNTVQRNQVPNKEKTFIDMYIIKKIEFFKT